ncbi:hypothetical protein PQU94_11035 [Asticcacaulis sp. DXS10W]|uniref:Uncharacterized protein n=1 Tax=Asticcacaulis currens TaxID=2984210 RepID=A0ABT5IF64_9CAUL|nr:hypothetical protein [Asticcacaulis currens]MDC7694814.1 hypothetical protein [Asticcacaulis currens]
MEPQKYPYPFREIELKIIESLDSLVARVRHRARNSVYCINRAWEIKDIDPNMSIFRAITAEEEAATALICALQLRKYPSSELLDLYNHRHKSGIYPFVSAILQSCGPIAEITPQIKLSHQRKRPEFSLMMAGCAEVPDPLNIMVFDGSGDGEDLAPVDFSPAMKMLAAERGASSVAQFVKEEANLRNRLLYALDNGVWRVDKPEQMIRERAKHVMVLLGIVLAVWQVRTPQMLAIHALESYLKALGLKIDKPHDFSDVIAKQRELLRNAKKS